jgi:predicted site-specific integrase-resolvase
LETTYTISEAAKILNRTVKCLQMWDRNGKLVSKRTKTNRRYYTEKQLLEFKGLCIKEENKKIYTYSRVSSPNQKIDLQNQEKIIKEYCYNKNYIEVIHFSEIGGGLNFNRKLFSKLLIDIQLGKVSKLIIAHKDRLCRFGFDMILNICKNYNCEIEVIDNEKLSPEQEMVQDLMTIIHCFSSRLYGLRNYKKSLKNLLKENRTSDINNNV